MACRGVLFAITNEQVNQLLNAPNDEAIEEIVLEEIEEQWDEEYLCQTDKAWDAIHRCLSDGTLNLEAGNYPLNRAIFGGQQLCEGGDFYVTLIASNEVPDVAKALADVTQDWIRTQYFNLRGTDYQSGVSEEDFDYIWSWFKHLGGFYNKAAEAHRAVIFTVDQ